MKASLISELTTELIEAQKAMDSISAEEICMAIDVVAIFVDANIDKYMDVTTKVAKHLICSETVQKVATHVTNVTVDATVKLYKDKEFMDASKSIGEMFNEATSRAEIQTSSTEDLKEVLKRLLAEIDRFEERIVKYSKSEESEEEKNARTERYRSMINLNKTEVTRINEELEARNVK